MRRRTCVARSRPRSDHASPIAAVEEALAETAGPVPERDEHDRKAADAFRRAVAASICADLTDLAFRSRVADQLFRGRRASTGAVLPHWMSDRRCSSLK